MKAISIIALGGNALIDPDLAPTVENQVSVAERAMKPVADLIERGERVVLVHGNGPQVGFMALRSELSKDDIHEIPLDALVATTQGSMGYMIQRALREELYSRGIKKEVVALVTEVEVDPEDQAFQEPTKPIGRFFTEEEAQILQAQRGWTMVNDSNRGWRKVVPSPAPVRIRPLKTIETLLEAEAIPICCGGGGIPVIRDENKTLHGVEGVIDKDRVSSLLGVRLGAQRFILTTGVDHVYRGFLSGNPTPIGDISAKEMRTLVDAGEFPPGSMGPKIKAALTFIANGGSEVTICKPEDLVAAFDGQKGTRILA